MKKITLSINTNDLILYHLLQRFVYQYHSLFSKNPNHPSLEDLTKLWFIKLFIDNQYFQNMPNSVLVNYQINENKDLLIVVRAPMYYKSFLVSLDKDIKSCITYTDNEGSESDLDLFSIDYVI
jgi:uncharacterized UPF0160 family protein